MQGDRLWSCLPYMRPLCGMLRDNCLLRDAPGHAANGGREESCDERGGITKWGGRCHDLLGQLPHCPFETLSPVIYTYSCIRCRHTMRSLHIHHVNRRIVRLPLPLQPHACHPAIPPRRIRRPRRSQRLPSHGARRAGQVFHGG
jgi:hypothetical protein